MARRGITQATLLVALGLTIGLVIALGVENGALKRRLERLSERALDPYPGLAVPAFETVTVGGDSVTIAARETGEKQVLFFFTTTCPYSKASFPAWNCVAARMRYEAGVRVYGIGLDSLQVLTRFAEQQTLSFPVVALGDRSYAELFRVRRVPLVLLVDDSGYVRYARYGSAVSDAPGTESSAHADTAFHRLLLECAQRLGGKDDFGGAVN